MLKNNVYIMNPPGYAGSFLRWILYKSEKSTADTTIDNPINYTSSRDFGGVGNAHKFDRRPTHCGSIQLMYWMIHNAPKEKLVYLLNEGDFVNPVLKNKGVSSGQILNFDSVPIIINLHSNFDYDKMVFGFMNLTLKWHFFTLAQHIMGAKEFPISDSQLNTREARTAYVELWDDVLYFNSPLTLDQIKSSFAYKYMRTWLDLRGGRNPHEVNNSDGQWVITPDSSRVYNIDFTDIFFNPSRLYDQLEVIFRNAGDFDFTYCRNFHQTYLDSQQTLGFFDSMRKFRTTGELDPLLTSHAVFEAAIIHEVFDKLPPDLPWQTMDLSEIITALKE
jgi:hypothetical protein